MAITNSNNAVVLDLAYNPNRQDFTTYPAEVQARCQELLSTADLLASEAGLTASEATFGPVEQVAGYGLSLAEYGGVSFVWVCEPSSAAVPANPFVVVAA